MTLNFSISGPTQTLAPTPMALAGVISETQPIASFFLLLIVRSYVRSTPVQPPATAVFLDTDVKIRFKESVCARTKAAFITA